MAQFDSPDIRKAKPAKGSANREVLRNLIAVLSGAVNSQLSDFSGRLVDALMKASEESFEAKQASLNFAAANLLKKNVYAFHFLATSHLQRALRREIDTVDAPSAANKRPAGELSLVTYDDMERKLLLGSKARPLESTHADQLTALRMRIANMLGRDDLSNNQNPFRPEVLLSAICDAWQEFDPDPETHGLILPALQPSVFLDLAPVYTALNHELIRSGVLTELSGQYNIKKTSNNKPAAKKGEGLAASTVEQLRQLFSPAGDLGAGGGVGIPLATDVPAIPMIPGVPLIPGLPGAPEQISSPFAVSGAGLPQAAFGQTTAETTGALAAQAAGHAGVIAQAGQAAAGSRLAATLGGLQKKLFAQQVGEYSRGVAPSASVLANIRAEAPQGMLTRVDENTIELLSKIFDVVFRDQNIPSEIKGLISFLQVPVLKAALVDKEFFFEEEHPARRAIEMLTQASVGWDQNKGRNDPLYKAIKRSVERIQGEFDHQEKVFSEVVTDLEAFIEEEENASAAALTQPIAAALRQEKLGQATKAAKNEVAMRIGTGEVVAFVETFLENKWSQVLTLAYTMKEEKPQAIENALRTMDDLIWSVKPKITMEERKELIAKLPPMLAALNKWLDLVKLDDAERVQFFAELAECHASIVRAPLEMSPQRRLEIAMQVAKEAAERRLQKKLEQEQKEALEPQPVADDFTDDVERLERGMWFEITREDATRKVRLAWVSPLRTLFIFSSRDKSESFSLSAEEMAQSLREGSARVIQLDGLVDRAINEAFEGANDADMNQQSAA